MPNFIDIDQILPKELRDILEMAKDIKVKLKNGQMHKPLADKQLAMIFEKPSTRTRVSFEVGINQLGGSAILLASKLGDREPICDMANVLARYVDLMMIRCFSHADLLEVVENSSVPVINGLSDYSHPCQIMADIMTFEEYKGNIKGKTIAWVGDGNNVATSWIHAAVQLGFTLNLATPEQLKPDEGVMKWAKDKGADVNWFADPEGAVKDADLVNTDTWVSMGDSDEAKRKKLLKGYQVNNKLMSLAKKDAIFMHCLPAYRGNEVTKDVIDGKASVIYDEAENRLHVQKAVMIWCFG